MIIFYILIALFIAWVWVDYFQKIDIFEKEKLIYLIIAFLFGTTSVILVEPFAAIFNFIPFSSLSEEMGLSLYFALSVGLTEELSKISLFLLFYLFFKKQINEPIDYVIYICVVALGFSATENVLYFNNYGANIITSRAIYCSLGHMFDTSLIAYGIIRYLYHPSQPKKGSVALYFLAAAFVHGFYDFWLTYNNGMFSFVTTVFFLISISLFATILNNAINNSLSFTYKLGLNRKKLSNRLLYLYLIIFILEYLILSLQTDPIQILPQIIRGLIFTGIIVLFSVQRISRFRLIKEKWFELKVELPFRISFASGVPHIQMRGISFGEEQIDSHFNTYVVLHELSRRKHKIGVKHNAYIEKKLLLKDDQMYYVASINVPGASQKILIKPKEFGKVLQNGKYPIVGMYKIDQLGFYKNDNFDEKNFKFAGWAALTK